jgi:uncharacterized protein YecE (DUF72 family)
MSDDLHIGTCSWKYESWRRLVYSAAPHPNYLAEYAQKYDCVEVDQWFWSLHGPDKVALPDPRTVQEYAAAVPAGFRFGVKLPNSLTLSHFHQVAKTDPLVPNPHFLSVDLLNRFLDRLEPIRAHLGPLMFQFGYLNKQKMPSQTVFLEKLGDFAAHLPKEFTWCIEPRNPNYLNETHFAFLRDHNLGHVFLQGYYMPSIFDLYKAHAAQLTGTAVIRLHGPDREGMEEKTGEHWDKIVEPRDADIAAVAAMIKDLRFRRRRVWAFINNHFEGCAPLTIRRITDRLKE